MITLGKWGQMKIKTVWISSCQKYYVWSNRVFGKLFDEQSSDSSIRYSHLQIPSESYDIYLAYSDKVHVTYKKVNYVSTTQSQSNINIPVRRMQPHTDPNEYEANTNVPFTCFGDKASLHESHTLLLINWNVKCAYLYYEWNNGIVFLHMKVESTTMYSTTHTGRDHIKRSFKHYAYQS